MLVEFCCTCRCCVAAPPAVNGTMLNIEFGVACLHAVGVAWAWVLCGLNGHDKFLARRELGKKKQKKKTFKG